MRNIRFFLLGSLLFLPCIVFGEGTRFYHKDPFVQQEFENIYQTIGKMITKSSTTATYLTKSSATTTYLQKSSASVTYEYAGHFGTIIENTPDAYGFGTTTLNRFWWKRIDNLVVVKGQWKCGTVASSEASIKLPSSLLINYSVMSSTQTVLGMWTLSKSENISSLDDHGAITTDGSTTNRVYFSRTGLAGSALPKEDGDNIGQTGSFIFVNFSYFTN